MLVVTIGLDVLVDVEDVVEVEVDVVLVGLGWRKESCQPGMIHTVASDSPYQVMVSLPASTPRGRRRTGR